LDALEETLGVLLLASWQPRQASANISAKPCMARSGARISWTML
jgi:hypothetical protein